MLVQCLIERLRPLIGTKKWDYIILWKLSDDNRCIEWLNCCCAGTENVETNDEDALTSNFRASSSLPCRDIKFPHQRIKSCYLLDQIPSSMTLDSGVHAQALLLNQVSWLNFSHNSDSIPSEETVGTRVLIPLYLGLVELFVTKQVPEDQQVIEFITAQSNFCLDQQIDPNVRNNPHNNDLFVQNLSKQNFDLPHEISIDRIQLCDPPLDPLQQFVSETEQRDNNANNNDYNSRVLLEHRSYEPTLYNHSTENGFGGDVEASRWNAEPSGNVEDQVNDESFMCENNRSDIDSDQNDEEEGTKYRRRTGKAPSKNLEAERKRRKKLNDRLYALRALVPNISKLDRAAILGDAIEYVKELQKQQENLQHELEQHSEDDEDATGKTVNNNHEADDVIIPPSFIHQNGTKRASKRVHENLSNGSHKGSSGKHRINNSKHNNEIDLGIEKVQQMEPQVEVFQLDGNEFLVKVFSEHKTGGFVRFMEALSSLGLEVTSVNTTRHTCLVSSIFRVERKNDEALQADHVKESLLELTRNPSRNWRSLAEESGNGKETDDDDYNLFGNYSHNSIYYTATK